MKPGVAIMREGASPLWRVRSLNGQAVRLPIPHWWDPVPYLTEVRAAGLDVLAVMDRDAFSDWNDWRSSADTDFLRMRELARAGLIQAVALGNEFDDGWAGAHMSDDPRVAPRGGISSWVMPFAEQAEMVSRAAQHLHGEVPLVLGGMSSGQPDVIDYFDLKAISAIQVHPYGKRPEVSWPNEHWGTGYIGWLLDPLRAKLDARGLSETVRMGIGELGVSTYDTDHGTAAEWFRRMLTYLRLRGDIDFTFIFCDSDLNVDGYGQFDINEHTKPSQAIIASIFREQPRVPLLRLPEAQPEPEEPEVPSGPDPAPEAPESPVWWDQHFSVFEIAEVLARVRTTLGRPTVPNEVLEAVTTHWAEVGPFLEPMGLHDDIPTKIALLATIFVETAYSFEPIDEFGSYDYFERRYGPQTAVGQQLGNIWPGDGAKYHGRGLIQITGRDNYRHYGQALDVPLEDMPDEAKHPTVAAAVAVAYFVTRNIPALARAGNWEGVRRAVNGGLNGWAEFRLAVGYLIDIADDEDGEHETDIGTLLKRVISLGETRIGDPYVWDGERPGAFDCSGFLKWLYEQALGIKLTSYTDAIYDETDPISQGSALPGDIVLYEYHDPHQPGVRFPHVGLVTDRPGITLDARFGVGVGYHADVQGAVRRYRRVRGLDAAEIPTEDAEELMWKEKAAGLINAVGYLGGDVADRLEKARAAIDDFGDPPQPPKNPSKATKADWKLYAEALEKWRDKVRTQTHASYQEIGAVGTEIRRVKQEFVG